MTDVLAFISYSKRTQKSGDKCWTCDYKGADLPVILPVGVHVVSFRPSGSALSTPYLQ